MNNLEPHGKKHNLVTPNTSLIVLDNVEDYVRYEIVPPAALQKQYHDLIASRNQKIASNKQDRISRLCNQFEEDKQWWKNAIDYRDVKEELKTNKPSSNKSVSARALSGVVVEDEMEIEEMETNDIEKMKVINEVKNKIKSNEKKKKRKKGIAIASILTIGIISTSIILSSNSILAGNMNIIQNIFNMFGYNKDFEEKADKLNLYDENKYGNIT